MRTTASPSPTSRIGAAIVLAALAHIDAPKLIVDHRVRLHPNAPSPIGAVVRGDRVLSGLSRRLCARAQTLLPHKLTSSTSWCRPASHPREPIDDRAVRVVARSQGRRLVLAGGGAADLD
jgi:hypothetical protein